MRECNEKKYNDDNTVSNESKENGRAMEVIVRNHHVMR